MKSVIFAGVPDYLYDLPFVLTQDKPKCRDDYKKREIILKYCLYHFVLNLYFV